MIVVVVDDGIAVLDVQAQRRHTSSHLLQRRQLHAFDVVEVGRWDIAAGSSGSPRGPDKPSYALQPFNCCRYRSARRAVIQIVKNDPDSVLATGRQDDQRQEERRQQPPQHGEQRSRKLQRVAPRDRAC